MAAFFVDLRGWTLWSIPFAIVAGAWLGGFTRDVVYTLVRKPSALPTDRRGLETGKWRDET
jgi:hypothetical protein